MRYAISKTAITWEQAESEIQYNDTGGVEITVSGVVGAGSPPQPLINAIRLIPLEIPIAADGPIGLTTEFESARRTRPFARYSGDDCIEVGCVYQIADPGTLTNQPDNTLTPDTSANDRASRQIATTDEPLLSHPTALAFPDAERGKLNSLLDGTIRANENLKPEADRTKPVHGWEFVMEDDTGATVEAQFSSDTVTVYDITASPLDYARLLAIGQTTYKAPSIRHVLTVSRDEAASNAQYNKVGKIVSTPSLAPDLQQDRQWFLEGITDDTDNGTTWITQYHFIASGEGGALKAVYNGGSKEI